MMVLDEYDEAIAEIYASGLMCRICRLSLKYLDNYVEAGAEIDTGETS